MSITLQNIVIERDSFSLGPLSFSFQSKGLYLIEGKNGSGKTSLLKAILGRLKLKAGKILKSENLIMSVGVEPIVYTEWTTEENFQFLSQMSESRTVFNPSAKQKYLPLAHMSSGQKRMSEIEIAFQISSPTLLLDEPGNSLDEENLKYFESQLIKQKEDRLIIMTSHIHKQSDLPFTDILRLQ